MIDREHKLSVARQAKLLGFSRGIVYYSPRPVPDGDLALPLATSGSWRQQLAWNRCWLQPFLPRTKGGKHWTTIMVDHEELHEIVEQKVTALVRELEAAEWSAVDVARAIQSIIKKRWLDNTAALQDATRALPDNFISDGNEG